MTPPHTPRLRHASRALILDEHDAVLLVCFPTEAGNYWSTPGGGLEPGESPVDGLRRELLEEVGQSELDIGPLLWTRTSYFDVLDDYDGQYNEIFLVRCERFDPEPAIGWDGMRAEGVSEIRWWTLDEIDNAPDNEVFVPSDVADLTRDLLMNGPPPATKSLNATSFGRAADEYHRDRPTYPVEAVEWMTQPLHPDAEVVDVGAGTGKLTTRLVELGFSVTAVDPDPDMLNVLSEHLRLVPTVTGSAELIGLADNSVDAAVFGQAWHWVDVDAASAELGRVVRPGGTLGLIWNVRDTAVDWVDELYAVIQPSASELMIEQDRVRVGAPFSHLEQCRTEWLRPMRRADIESMVRTRSGYLTANPRNRARMDAAVADIFDRLGLGANDEIDFPYVTHAYRAERAETVR